MYGFTGGVSKRSNSVSSMVGFLNFFLTLNPLLNVGLLDILKNSLNFTDESMDWSLYIIIIGFIMFGIGIYYLYSYFNNRKFVMQELKTNKRSEFLKKHVEVKQKVKHLPSKYHKMLKEKEKDLQIK